MFRKILYTIALSGIVVIGYSQNMIEAYRLSNIQLQGTARSTAMGNAFGALGGDFTSTSINPAGIGLYQSNEFQATMQLGTMFNKASYLGTNTKYDEANFSIPSLSYVSTIKTRASKNNSLVSVNFGIGFNRMGDFNMGSVIRGSRATSSVLDQWAYNANYNEKNGFGNNTFHEGLAADVNAIYKYDNKGNYYHDMQKNQSENSIEPSENFAHDQVKSIYQKGRLDEYVLSMSFNINHKLYIGATFGIQDYYYSERSVITEDNVDYEGNQGFESYLNSYKFAQYLETYGTGINFKIGAIYKPIDQLRLGIAVHTPTYYTLTEGYETKMSNDYNLLNENNTYERYFNEYISENYNEYDYSINSPMRAILSAAYIIGKRAILSVDYEYLDYSTMKLRKGGDGYDFYYENEDINNTFDAVGNLRVGAEIRVNPEFSLRGGYEYLPNGFKSEFWSSEAMSYSVGFGYRVNNFYIDAAYKRMESTSKFELYQIPMNPTNNYSDPIVDMKHTRNFFNITFGMKF